MPGLVVHSDVPLVDLGDSDERNPHHLAEMHDHPTFNASRTGSPGAATQIEGFIWDPGILTMFRSRAAGRVAAINRPLLRHERVPGSSVPFSASPGVDPAIYPTARNAPDAGDSLEALASPVEKASDWVSP